MELTIPHSYQANGNVIKSRYMLISSQGTVFTNDLLQCLKNEEGRAFELVAYLGSDGVNLEYTWEEMERYT